MIFGVRNFLVSVKSSWIFLSSAEAYAKYFLWGRILKSWKGLGCVTLCSSQRTKKQKRTKQNKTTPLNSVPKLSYPSMLRRFSVR